MGQLDIDAPPSAARSTETLAIIMPALEREPEVTAHVRDGGNHVQERRRRRAGRALIDMLDGCQHRGLDSTGFALYGDALERELRLRFFVGEGGTRRGARDEIGYAKDRLAVKPMIMYETDDLVAVASEEVSLNRLFPGQALNTREPPPGTYATWSRSI